MIRNLFLAFLSCVAVFAFGTKSSAQSFPDTAWMKLYGGSMNDWGRDIKQTFDGGYIVLGTSSSDDGDLGAAPTGDKQWVLKLDSQGNIEWQNFYPGIFNGSSIIQTKDSGYVFGTPFITKLKQDGTLDWQATVSAAYVIQTKEGGYAGLNNHTITKLSSTGSVEWDSSYALPWMASSTTFDIRQTADSGFVFAGYWQEDVWTKGWWLVKTDKNGTETLNTSPSDWMMYNSLEVAMDGNLLLTASGYTNNYTRTTPQQVWQQTIDSVSIRDIMENVDSTIVMCGNNHGTTIDSFVDSRIIKAYPNGDTIITVTVGGNHADFLSKINPTRDTGYIAIGNTRSYEGNYSANHGLFDLWIIKYKEDTAVYTPGTPLAVVKSRPKNDEIKVYPTITKGTVHVLLSEDVDATISVINSLGQQVVKQRSATPSQYIDISGHPAGMYILQVMTGNERQSFKVLLTN